MKSILCLMAVLFASSAWAGKTVNLSNCLVQSLNTNSNNVSTLVVHGCEGTDGAVALEVPLKSADGTNNLQKTLVMAVAHSLRLDVHGEERAGKSASLDSVTLRAIPQL